MIGVLPHGVLPHPPSVLNFVCDGGSTGADSFTSLLLTPNEPHPDMDPTVKRELSAELRRGLKEPFGAHSAQFIYFTSGSTGKPKGVVISGGSVTNNAKSLGFRKGISGGLDVGAVTQPFSHVGGLVVNMLSQMMHGVTNVLPAPSFDPRATLAAVQEEVKSRAASALSHALLLL